jgi:hypothetical protein
MRRPSLGDDADDSAAGAERCLFFCASARELAAASELGIARAMIFDLPRGRFHLRRRK